MNRILLDSSVLIDIWRKGESGWPVLETSSNYVSTISYIEFLQGANRRQKKDALGLLNRYDHVRLDAATSDAAVALIDKHSETDGLRLADALIAAACLVHDLDLLTLNRRHFQKIVNLKLI